MSEMNTGVILIKSILGLLNLAEKRLKHWVLRILTDRDTEHCDVRELPFTRHAHIPQGR
jgi:hypothetical protein